MHLIIVESPAQMARLAADRLAAQLAHRPDSVLGLPTGDTPLALYRELVRRQRRGELDLSRATTFNLDEYLGLGPDHPTSYAHYMRRHLFAPAGMDSRRTHLPDGTAADPHAEAERYEAAIRAAGGIDLQLLGIGVNGHIGFNEPGSPLDSRTRVVELCATTRSANRRHFPCGEAPPTHAITLGIATILEARRLLLLATGSAKATALRAALQGPISAGLPASVLQRHPACVAILDAAAATALDPATRQAARLSASTLSSS